MSFKTFLQEFLRSINKIYVVYAEKVCSMYDQMSTSQLSSQEKFYIKIIFTYHNETGQKISTTSVQRNKLREPREIDNLSSLLPHLGNLLISDDSNDTHFQFSG